MQGRRGFHMALAGALALGLVATACAQDEPTIQADGEGARAEGHGEDEGEGHEAQGTVTIGGEEATNHGTEDVTGRGEFELELDDFYFGPTILEGDANQTLTLRLRNEGDAPHTFTIEEANVDEELQPGDEELEVDVTFPSSGALAFVCTFHRAQGMIGALSVGGSLETGGGGGSQDGDGSDDEPGSGPGY